MNIRASVNPGRAENPQSTPFIMIDSDSDKSGFLNLYWSDCTPKLLRDLADRLEQANREHAEGAQQYRALLARHQLQGVSHDAR